MAAHLLAAQSMVIVIASLCMVETQTEAVPASKVEADAKMATEADSAVASSPVGAEEETESRQRWDLRSEEMIVSVDSDVNTDIAASPSAVHPEEEVEEEKEEEAESRGRGGPRPDEIVPSVDPEAEVHPGVSARPPEVEAERRGGQRPEEIAASVDWDAAEDPAAKPSEVHAQPQTMQIDPSVGSHTEAPPAVASSALDPGEETKSASQRILDIPASADLDVENVLAAASSAVDANAETESSIQRPEEIVAFVNSEREVDPGAAPSSERPLAERESRWRLGSRWIWERRPDKMVAAAAPATAATNGEVQYEESEAAARRRQGWPQSRAGLGALCYLGDASVDIDVPDCRDVTVPSDYVNFCGRWMCSDPVVDHCYFTDADSIRTVDTSSTPEIPLPDDAVLNQPTSQDAEEAFDNVPADAETDRGTPIVIGVDKAATVGVPHAMPSPRATPAAVSATQETIDIPLLGPSLQSPTANDAAAKETAGGIQTAAEEVRWHTTTVQEVPAHKGPAQEEELPLQETNIGEATGTTGVAVQEADDPPLPSPPGPLLVGDTNVEQATSHVAIEAQEVLRASPGPPPPALVTAVQALVKAVTRQEPAEILPVEEGEEATLETPVQETLDKEVPEEVEDHEHVLPPESPPHPPVITSLSPPTLQNLKKQLEDVAQALDSANTTMSMSDMTPISAANLGGGFETTAKSMIGGFVYYRQYGYGLVDDDGMVWFGFDHPSVVSLKLPRSKTVQHRHWRPVCLPPCVKPSPGKLFGVVSQGTCNADAAGLEDGLPDEPMVCSEEQWKRWEKDTWKQLFLEQSLAQEEELRKKLAEQKASGNVVCDADCKRKRLASQCRPYEPFIQCDAHNGPFLDRVWRRFGLGLQAKLGGYADDNDLVVADADVNKSHLWRACAKEGELCLCTGEVRFGVAGHWAPDVLTVPHGIVSCSADLFDGAASQPDGITQICECRSVRIRGPLIAPSNETVPAWPNTTQSNDSQVHSEPRFIQGTEYTDEILRGVRYDYSSIGAGARLVTQARGIHNAHKVLSADPEYMRTICSTRAWFVVSLLEDLFLEHIGLVTLELFASGFRHLQILGSTKYPTQEWRLLGEIETSPSASREIFDIGSRCRRTENECWIRFLKVRVLSHHELEDNTYCALTRFQVFGSTQIAYIAEEKTALDAADRETEPRVVDVADWHDRAAHLALASPLESNEFQAFPIPEEQQAYEEQHADSDLFFQKMGDLLNLQDSQPTQSPPQQALGMLKRFTTWLTSPRLPRPSGDDGVQVSDAEALEPVDVTGGEFSNVSSSGPDEKIESRNMSSMERAQLSLSEFFTDMNATGALTDVDLSSFDKLRSALGALNGSTDWAAIPSVLVGSSVSALAASPAPPAPRPAKASPSTPALVRINNDLRVVQESQVRAEKNAKSVASGISSVLVLVLEALREHSSRVSTMEDKQKPFEDLMHPLSSTTELLETSLDSDGWWNVVAWLRNGTLTVFSHVSVDRFLLIILFAWTFLRTANESSVVRRKPSIRRKPSYEDPYRHEERESTRESPKESPLLPTVQPLADPDSYMLNEYTVSGARGKRLMQEFQRQEKRTRTPPNRIRKLQPPPLLSSLLGMEAPTESEDAVWQPQQRERSALAAQRPSSPPSPHSYPQRVSSGRDFESEMSPPSSGSEAERPFARRIAQLFSIGSRDANAREPSSSERRQRRMDAARVLPPGQRRGPKRHSSAARRHAVRPRSPRG